MAAIAPPRSSDHRTPSGGGSGNRGGVPEEKGYGGGGGSSPDESLPERRYYTGMLVGLAGIVMLFTGLSSAYVVRKGLSSDWVPLQLPTILWLNSFILMASSFTIEKAKRSLSSVTRLRRWWLLTVLLGVGFLVGQWLAWRQLVRVGVYLNSNPSSSFFYVLTVSHALHLAGGIIAMAYLTLRLWRGRLTRVATGVMALYWHFMDGLWLYLLLLLVIWR